MSVHETLPDGCEPLCHGCHHRLLRPVDSLDQKGRYLRRVLEPWATRLRPVVPAEGAQRLGYRDRVTLSARWSADVGWHFGLMRRDELVAIHDCPVHTPRVREIVRAMRQWLPSFDSIPLAYLHIAGAQATLIVKAHSVPLESLQPLLEALRATGLEGLWLHLHPSAGRRLFARSGWRLLWGSGESRDPDGLLHGPTAFMQAVPALHREAMSVAAEHLRPGAGTRVLDLYCGVGAALRMWTAAGSEALGVELSGEAVACAVRNAPAARLLRGNCAERLPQIRTWWTAEARDRVAYVNPPRLGLEAAVSTALARELRPSRIAYLSCSAGTLARDLGEFAAAGYTVSGIQPYDFFPLTHHVETLALLERQ